MSRLAVALVIVPSESIVSSAAGRGWPGLTADELRYARSFRDPVPALAARLAAKGAARLLSRTLGDHPLAFAEVAVDAAPFRAPRLVVSAGPIGGIGPVWLSLSHCRGYAGALLAAGVSAEP